MVNAPQEIAAMIRALTPRELVLLDRLLRDEPLGGLDLVREPRRPSPESPGDRIAVGPDYADSAE